MNVTLELLQRPAPSSPVSSPGEEEAAGPAGAPGLSPAAAGAPGLSPPAVAGNAQGAGCVLPALECLCCILPLFLSGIRAS